jgi:single-strand DNA-binding protein
MNSVTLIGSLTKDPELRKRGETKICSMRLAEGGKKNGAQLFINVSTFGRQAEVCKEYLAKGRQVAVTGQLRFREWENDEGQKRSEHTISADRVNFLPSGGGSKAKAGGTENGRRQKSMDEEEYED